MLVIFLRLMHKRLRHADNGAVQDGFLSPRLRQATRNAGRVCVRGGGVATLIVIAACGKTSTSTVAGPSPAKCAVSVAASAEPVAAGGAVEALTVTTQPECTWTAAADVSWITELTPATGQGSGEVHFRVTPNPDGRSRQGAITVGDQKLEVRQQAAPCRLQIAATDGRFDARGGAATVSVTAPDGCTWSASSTARWIVVSAPTSGDGSGAVRFEVMPNDGAERSGAINIGGEALAISQSRGAPDCAVSIDPSAAAMPAAGGTATFNVISAAGCEWTAESSVSWITIVDGARGSGRATVRFRVTSNAGGSRTGRIEVGATAFTVNQSGSGSGSTCSYSVSPTSLSMSGTGGRATVAVSTAAGCSWSATSSASWVRITSGATGSGSGTVAFDVDSFSGTTRTGTLALAGTTVTLTQTGQTRCSYDISPKDRDANALGGVFTVSVKTTSGCSWTANANVNWISIASGATGTGNGTVSVVVAPNPTSLKRTGTATIAEQTFTVKQAELKN